MSIDWNLTKIKNNKELCWVDGVMNPATHELIFSTIAVGMGEITEKNWEEFSTRLHIWETAHGFKQLGAQVVKSHIGLQTNVFPKDTEAQFFKRIKRALNENAQKAFKADMKEKTDA